MVPPSDSLDCRDRVDDVEIVELAGVDTERSSNGTASSARDGETLGDGELDRRSGEVTLLNGGLVLGSDAISIASSQFDSLESRYLTCTYTSRFPIQSDIRYRSLA